MQSPIPPNELLRGIGAPFLVAAVLAFVIRVTPTWIAVKLYLSSKSGGESPADARRDSQRLESTTSTAERNQSLSVPGDHLRQSMALPFAVAFVVGICLLETVRQFEPTQYWHWLFYAIPFAGLFSGAAAAPTLSWFEKLVMRVAVALAVGWLLVPNWPEMNPSRLQTIFGFAVLVSAAASAIELIARRQSGPWLGCWLTLIALVTSVMVILAGSLRFGQLGLAIFGATAGCTLGSLWKPRLFPQQGIGLAYAIGVTGLLMMGKVETFSEMPLYSFVLVIAAVLAIGAMELTIWLLFERLFGRPIARWLVVLGQLLLVIAFLIAGVVTAIRADPSIVEFGQ